MISKRTFIHIFLACFLALTIYLYLNGDKVALTISKNGFKGAIYYFLTNANYILILISIILLNREVSFIRNLIGGIFSVVSFDIVSMPRMLQSNVSQDLGFLASMDGIVITKLLSLGMDYSTIYTLYYLVFPIVLVIASLNILGIDNFYRRIMGKG